MYLYSTPKRPSCVVICAKMINLFEFEIGSNVPFSLQISVLLFYILLTGHCRGAAPFIISHQRGYLANLVGVAKRVNGIVYLNIFRRSGHPRSLWMSNR